MPTKKKHKNAKYNPLPSSQFIYRNLKGDQIKNPAHSIANNIKTDYLAEHPETESHIAELWGRRPTQQDRIAVGKIPEFDKLEVTNESIEETRKTVLRNTVHALQTGMPPNTPLSGSTLCLSVLCKEKVNDKIVDKIYVANVSDSESYLVIRDEKKVVVEFKRINQQTHHITQENIGELKQLGCNIQLIKFSDGIAPRLASSAKNTNMFRTMGSDDFVRHGMRHTPNIYCETVSIPPGGDAFVMTCCDGLTESMSQAEIKAYFNESHNVPLNKMPGQLAMLAYVKGSFDNISVIISPVETREWSIYLAIFDGNGPETDPAEYLRYSLRQVFTNCCKKNNKTKPNILSTENAEAKELVDNIILPKLIGKPKFQLELAFAKSLSHALATKELEDAQYLSNKLLFRIYLQLYRTSMSYSFIRGPRLADNLTSWTEALLVKRCPEISKNMPCEPFYNHLRNRILYTAGELYNDFASDTLALLRYQIESISNLQDSPRDTGLYYHANQQARLDHKQRFLNTAKLLARLGDAGFHSCSLFFTNKCEDDVLHINESVMLQYYEQKAREISQVSKLEIRKAM